MKRLRVEKMSGICYFKVACDRAVIFGNFKCPEGRPNRMDFTESYYHNGEVAALGIFIEGVL